MTRKSVYGSGTEKEPRRPDVKLNKTRWFLLAVLVAVLVWVIPKWAPMPSQLQSKPLPTHLQSHLRPTLAPAKIKATVNGPVDNRSAAASSTNYSMLTRFPMQLTKKVLVSKPWNNGPDCFGLDKPPAGKEGATVGPAAVTYFDGKLYVLDNANKRILAYDTAGNLISSLDLPNNVATDLSVDASGSALILIDHLNDRVYKVNGNELVFLSSLPLKENFPLGTKFSYDPDSNLLSTQEVHQDGLADIDGNNLVLNGRDGTKLAIPFDKPVACVEEIITDASGIMWVLYTLEGDYQMRRIARVDRTKGTVATAEVDVYFAFDATRHMTATGTGVVLFGGDTQEGRLISFNYAGAAF